MIVVVRRENNLVEDVNQKYDDRYFDHVDAPDGTVVGAPQRYMRAGTGDIVLCPVPRDVYREAIAAATTLDALKAALLLK